MSQAGTDLPSLELNGRTILRRAGALRLADGTLAGADLTLDGAVRNIVAWGNDLAVALQMASRFPAEAIASKVLGRLEPNCPADLVYLGPDLAVRGVWRGGAPLLTEN